MAENSRTLKFTSHGFESEFHGAGVEGHRRDAARVMCNPLDQAVGEVRATGPEPTLRPKHLVSRIQDDLLAAPRQLQRG